MRFVSPLSGVLGCALASALVGVLAQTPASEDARFMPKGGRALLLEVVGKGAGADELRQIAQSRRTEAQWREFANTRGKALTDRERSTLAAYLAVNMPMTQDKLKQPEWRASLPRDGRDLAWEQCQLCHSLFTSHLTQDRDVQAWRNMFMSPFHRELKMTPQEREEFARYSALNMPMKIDDVPSELRF
jgi:hypothetical protein